MRGHIDRRTWTILVLSFPTIFSIFCFRNYNKLKKAVIYESDSIGELLLHLGLYLEDVNGQFIKQLEYINQEQSFWVSYKYYKHTSYFSPSWSFEWEFKPWWMAEQLLSIKTWIMKNNDWHWIHNCYLFGVVNSAISDLLDNGRYKCLVFSKLRLSRL